MSNIDKLVVLEDSIMQKNEPITAGSKILENFVSPIEATVITRLLNNGYAIKGRCGMNEFGILPLCDEAPQISGVIKAVANGEAKFALCNDYAGIYRHDATQNGVYYIHPTYGTVSRYGLVHAVSSMDQIGVVCADLSEGFKLLGAMAGHDNNDGAMFAEKSYEYKASSKNITVTAPQNALELAIPADREAIAGFMKGFEAVKSELAHFGALRQVQYILSCGELTGNLSRYDGIKFGYRTKNYKNLEELYLNTRTEAFGRTAKLSLIMGSMALSKEYYEPYYDKALRLRRLIKESLRFDHYDVIVLPGRIGGDLYDNSAVYAIATLAGLPSISMPFGDGCIQLLAAPKNEGALIKAMEVAG